MTDSKQIRAAVSDNLRRLLIARGWSQADLARRIFADLDMKKRVQVNRWVNGKSTPTAADLLNLAEAFGVSPDEIGREKKGKKAG